MREALNAIIANPLSSIADVQSQLAAISAAGLGKPQFLAETLNSAEDDETHPLHVAIEHSPYAVVKLLLEYDCQVRETTLDILETRSAISYIKGHPKADWIALLEFYRSLQEDISRSSDFRIGETLRLISGAARHFESVSRYRDGILVVGSTGVGKSTITNALAGCNYAFVDEDKDAVTLQGGSAPESTGTSGEGASETTHPKIVTIKYEEKSCNVIDMPGMFDNRGGPQNIANAWAARALQHYFSSIQGIIFVVDPSRIKKARGTDFQDSCSILAEVLSNQPDLASNLVIVVNQLGSDNYDSSKSLTKIKERLSSMSKQIQEIFSSLTEERVVCLQDSPGQALRDNFAHIIKTLVPHATAEYNLGAYTQEAAEFNEFQSRLLDFQGRVQEEQEHLVALLVGQLAAANQNMQRLVVPNMPEKQPDILVPEQQALEKRILATQESVERQKQIFSDACISLGAEIGSDHRVPTVDFRALETWAHINRAKQALVEELLSKISASIQHRPADSFANPLPSPAQAGLYAHPQPRRLARINQLLGAGSPAPQHN